ncbi:hypothetical protein [Staphylothermus hellenicus]|uniref:Uncharacterized protein n=1 Tax=Staphylothermus hellenicus (strain DSM 12710 / JCM 10830 / BK20S6-10-b1 / P8) TaxID=591019 RepID=D7DBV6_STAHD|nr:hypothetical protein [Staphylothermus hellenicus]ADI31653.1 hypothetical protein Shell_0522 [Staphylothermus hellenicus DSM 12710]
MPRIKKIVYEDQEVIVALAPRDEELPEMVLETIKEKGRPMFFDELIKEFSGIAGEDRLRKAVNHLLALGAIIEFPDGSLGTPDMKWIPRKTRRRRRRRTPRLMSDMAMPKTYYKPPEQ